MVDRVLVRAPLAPGPRCVTGGHVYGGPGGWRACACGRAIPAHDATPPDPAGGPGCGMVWRVCARCAHVEEHHVLDHDDQADDDRGYDDRGDDDRAHHDEGADGGRAGGSADEVAA